MKVLIISPTVVDYVSVGKITIFLYDQLKKNGHDAKLIYFGLNGKQRKYISINKNELITKIRYKLVLMSKFEFHWHYMGEHRWRKIIKEYDPDIIQMIQPMEEYIDTRALFGAIGQSRIPCVYTMIDESAYLGNCDNAYQCRQFMESNGCEGCKGKNYKENLIDYGGYWNTQGCVNKARLKSECYQWIDKICFVAPEWVIERAKQSVMLKGRKFYEVDEYVNNEDIYYPREPDDKVLRQYGVDRSKILFLNVARYSNARKGIKYYIELARKFEADDRYQFIQIGYDGNGVGLPQNYVSLPFIKDQNITSMFYSIADLFIITSLADTMPNVCLEALSCGTPICGFNVSGIPYVAKGQLGVFVEPENVDELARIVGDTKKKSSDMVQKCREYAIARYSTSVYIKKMIKIYENEKNDKEK